LEIWEGIGRKELVWFSIFAGTAIITSFLLLYVCVPISLDCSDRVWEYLKSLLPPSSESKLSQKFIKFYSKTPILNSNCYTLPLQCRKWFSKLNFSVNFWTVSFLLCGTILAVSSFTVFYSPGFQLPDSEQFQLLSTSHPVEVFDRLVAPTFNQPTVDDEYKLSVYLIWGIRPIDTGNGLNPKNVGTLQFDPNFSLVAPENQKWMKAIVQTDC